MFLENSHFLFENFHRFRLDLIKTTKMHRIERRIVGKLICVRGATIKHLQKEHNIRMSISKGDDQVN